MVGELKVAEQVTEAGQRPYLVGDGHLAGASSGTLPLHERRDVGRTSDVEVRRSADAGPHPSVDGVVDHQHRTRRTRRVEHLIETQLRRRCDNVTQRLLHRLSGRYRPIGPSLNSSQLILTLTLNPNYHFFARNYRAAQIKIPHQVWLYH